MTAVTLGKGTEHERSLEALDPIDKRSEPRRYGRPYRPPLRKTVKLMIVFQEDILLRLEAEAKQKGMSVQEEIRNLVGEALANKGKQS